MRLLIAASFIYSLILNPAFAVENEEEPQFLADYQDAQWQVDSTPFICRLKQSIPRYGQAEFVHEAGEGIFFQLLLANDVTNKPKTGKIDFKVPVWRHDKEKQATIDFAFKTPGIVELKSRDALKLLQALDNDRIPTFLYPDESFWKPMSAGLSPVRFQDAYDDFENCEQKVLLPVNFKTVASSRIYFESGSIFLTDEARKWLDYVVAYGISPALRKIELMGATDRVGTYESNRLLADLRVEEVKDYLLARGIPLEKLSLKVYGSSHPIADNKTDIGRSKNRRVEIRMYR